MTDNLGDLEKRLRAKAGLVQMRGSVGWLSEVEVMNQAADALAVKDAEIDRLRAELAGQRMCVNCGKYAPEGHDRTQPLPECVDKDGYSGCTFDLTPQEAWEHWRKIAHDQRAALAAKDARIAELNALLDRQLGTPCEQIQHHEALSAKDAEIERLTRERNSAVQTSAMLCDDCGWSMKFPSGECVYCGFHTLEAREAEALAKVARMREAGKAMDHAANEWADTASNAFQWIKNIRDGISTPPSALASLEECFAHCRSVWSTARAEMDKL